MAISNILSIAKTALMANQTALRVTSNNISNVNTPGYTRQRVSMNSAVPVLEGYNVFGMGVAIDGIERVYDRFLQSQIRGANTLMGMYDGSYTALNRLEAIFNDAQGMGLESTLNEFFNALNDISTDPQGLAARITLMAKADALTVRMNSIDSRVRSEIATVESTISGTVDDINDLTSRIAMLNQKIASMEVYGDANDLRDQRELLILGLSERIDIFVIEDETGHSNIMTTGGVSLLIGLNQTVLSTQSNLDNSGTSDILAGQVNITSNIVGGRLRGLLDTRDNNLLKSLDKIDMLAASLTKELNVLHNSGFGLDGSTGIDLFAALAPVARAGAQNTGGALAVASIYDKSLLTLDTYEVKFIDSANFHIRNVTTGAVTPVQVYATGTPIDIDGVRFVITDSTTAPAAGDTFTINTTENAARNFAVSLTDASQFAAATDIAAVPGDNTNVLAMISVIDNSVTALDNTSFNSFYQSIVSEVGAATGFAKTNVNAQAVVYGELTTFRDSISGVSMDEEGVNLIKYQHAYEAAAKVITTIDSMFDTILRMR